MDNRRVGYDTDVCDPLGCVLECGRVPVRLRRRCRSEGLDRSPYDDVKDYFEDSVHLGIRAAYNKSHFTINSDDRFQNECVLPSSENGDYFMAHDQRYHRYQSSRSKIKSPSRPITVGAALTNGRLDDRLPKVEELFEKNDQDMMELAVAKQPLKPILNTPLPKTPPHGILKKPKSKVDKSNIEGRRRQRASSESDNTFCSFQLSQPMERLAYMTGNTMKRAKDNSGYSYGTAIASLNYGPIKANYAPKSNNAIKEKVAFGGHNGMESHILRTTAINDKRVEDASMNNSRQQSPARTCPAISPSLPVSSVTTLAKSTLKKKRRPKSPEKKKCDDDIDPSLPVSSVTTLAKNALKKKRRPKSPEKKKTGDDDIDPWQMDTDAIVAEVARIEATPSPKSKKPQNAEPIPTVPSLSEPIRVEIVDKKPKNAPEGKANGSVGNKELHKSTANESPICLADVHCVRASLFPRVPPYLKFISHEDAPCLKIPVAIQKHLKWKMTTITPIVVKKTLTNSGFRLVKSECDTAECPQEETVEWVGIWGKHMKSIMFRAIKDGQKMNHFPGTFQIGRKDRLWRNLQKLSARHGAKEFGIMPKTYVLPHDMKILKHDWEKHVANNEKWIIKPPASARGTGIKVVSKWTQIPKKRPVVVQRYVSKPYLINGNKFDMRLYVLVTSIHPLRIYLYKDGLARFASVKYNDEIASLNDRYMHLTNYSINRLSKNYTPNEDFAACEGHKWTLQTLFQYLRTEKQIDTESLWEDLKDLVIKTIISGEGSISSLTKANVTSRYNCYELFGIDVLLDEELKPWLLEVNISPSLHSASPLDIHVKGPLVTTVLNIAQFQLPNKISLEALCKEKPSKYRGLPYDSRLYTVYLSKEERDKHIIYTNMDEREMYLRDILSTLTPDDVRHLIQAEDELTQTGDMERVFPTKHTHKYLVFLNGARYYNRLFDAWETRYGSNRSPGVELLRNLCDIGYHLDVPQVPLKRRGALSACDGCRMTWTRPRRRRPWRAGPRTATATATASARPPRCSSTSCAADS